MIKNFAKKLTPPIVLSAISRLRALRMPEFETWEEALKSCGVGGYEQEMLTGLIAGKTGRYRDSLSEGPARMNPTEIQTITALGSAISQSNRSDRFTVIDYGGACGAHFFLAQRIFKDISFDWRIVETPVMAEAAAGLAGKGLRFYTDIHEAIGGGEPIHLVHSSGTLTFVRDSYPILETLLGTTSEFVLLSRLGLTPESSDILTVHRHPMSLNGPGVAPPEFEDEMCAYPARFLQKAKVEAMIRKENYDIDFLHEDPSGGFDVKSHEILGLSYFCRKKQ